MQGISSLLFNVNILLSESLEIAIASTVRAHRIVQQCKYYEFCDALGVWGACHGL